VKKDKNCNKKENRKGGLESTNRKEKKERASEGLEEAESRNTTSGEKEGNLKQKGVLSD